MKILPYARKIIINPKKMCVEIIIIVLFLKIFNIISRLELTTACRHIC